MSLLGIINRNDFKLFKFTFAVLFYCTAICYQCPIFITKMLGLYRYDICIGAIDNVIPFLEYFIVFYVYYYVYFCYFTIYIARIDIDVYFRLISSLVISCTIGALIFIFFPTVFNFNHGEHVSEGVLGLFFKLGRVVDIECNAFPSFHVTKTWLICRYFLMSYCGSVFNSILFVISSVLIILSTVFIKVHGFIDIVGAMFIVEVVIYLERKYDIGAFVKDKIFSRVND